MIARNAKDLGALIRERRRALGMDQRALADRIGVRRLWVIEAERGKPGARVDLVLRAVEALGLRVLVEAPGPAADDEAPRLPDIDAIVEAARGPDRG